MKSASYLSTLTLVFVLQAGALKASAAVLAPVEGLTPAPAWSPKIKPGLKPAPGGDRRPRPPFQPCYPDPRACRGGF